MDESKQRFRYDAVVKDLFLQDRPSLLDEWMGGRKIEATLNPEFQVVQERIADLLFQLEGETLLHLDFQSENDADMAHRAGIYALMASMKYRRQKVEQFVLYLGDARLHMPAALDIGCAQVAYRLIDIREIDTGALLATGRAGDYALAMLARGGVEHLRQIIEAANGLPGRQRQRVLTQMAILAGLRGASEQLTMEFKTMGISVEIERNVFLKNIYDSGKAEGLAKGKAEGKAEAMTTLLRELLEAKFGTVPRWAEGRLATATADQAERWALKVLSASTFEDVFGGR